MSKGYTSDGRRLSSMTHAARSHPCDLCGATPSGNGGKVSHGRSHVRKGEAVELVRHFEEGQSHRVFLRASDTEQIDWYTSRDYTKEEDPRG